MRFFFISEGTFEPWDWTNPDTVGIGGSETSHIEMAQRLQKMGHEVFSFAPTPFAGPRVDPAGVTWFHIDQLDWTDQPDIWIIYRAPGLAAKLPAGAVAWLVCQDVDYMREGNCLNAKTSQHFTRIVALCETQGEYLRAVHPEAADRVCVSSNGIKAARIREVLENPPERNPHRLMYASSPDRGLLFLLAVFPRIRERVPDLELHIYYGFDNIEKVIEYYGKGSDVDRKTNKVRALLEQPGVHYHGRTGQPELAAEWFKASIWCHPSNFTETSCITCMDAQASGAIPVTGPVWAIAENVKHGVFVQGNAAQELVQARYALEVFRLLMQPELQEELRAEMMPWALEAFDWDNFAGQWEGWARHDLNHHQSATRAAGDQNAMTTDRPSLRLVPRHVPDISPEELVEYPGIEVPA